MCQSGGGASQSAMAEKLYGITADISQEQYDTWKQIYMPMEKQTIGQINAMSTPEYMNPIVAQNTADIAREYGKIRGEQGRQFDALGITGQLNDPYSSASRELTLGQAGQTAGVSNITRSSIIDQQMAARMGLTQMGRGVSSQAIQGLQGAAGGYSGIASRLRAQTNAENAGMGQAVGTIGMIAAAAGF